MKESKTISIMFPNNVKLSSKMGPISEEDRIEMSQVSYVSDVGSLMFSMICTRQEIAHAVGVVSDTWRIMVDGGKSTTCYPSEHKSSMVQGIQHFIYRQNIYEFSTTSLPEKVEEITVDIRKMHTIDTAA
ncbi:hypothetical protein Tco_1334678 [Tanacetum coccineum]